MGRPKKNSEKEEKTKLPSLPNLNLAEETKRSLAVIVFALLSAITFLAALNLAGSLGKFILDLLKQVAGILAYMVPLLLALVAFLLAKQKMPQSKEHGFYWRIYLGTILLTASVAALVHLFYLGSGYSAFALAS